MSLFSSIRLASNTLRADQIAMQVIGQNMANANTPGYIREETILAPAGTQKLGNLMLGMGVEVQAVVQKIDEFLEERLRGAIAQRSNSQTQEQTYVQLEGIINELGETDLSTSLTSFFNSIQEVLSEPGNTASRRLVASYGNTLATDINRLAKRVSEIRRQLNERVQDISDGINSLTEEIRVLNIRIAQIEGGDTSQSDAVGLRDQRLAALEKLANLIDIRVREQPSGGVTIYSGGDFLVFEGTRRPVEVVAEFEDGLTKAGVYLSETEAPLNASAGELNGLIVARDDVLGGFLNRLDEFAGTLIYEFNKLYSSGQGLSGYQELTSGFAVTASDVALDQAGLEFTPVNGSLQVLLYNTENGLTQTNDILVKLRGEDDDMTLEDLAAAFDAVDGITAEIDVTGKLIITSDSPEQKFAFKDDTSGVLAALGLNVFFTGSTALNIGVNRQVVDDPGKFAASKNGIGVDTDNAIDLAGFLDRPLQSQDGDSLAALYNGLLAEVVQGSTITRNTAEGDRVFEQTLHGQKLATSGVSLDEEAVRLIAHQQSFQASARYIGILKEMLEILVSL